MAAHIFATLFTWLLLRLILAFSCIFLRSSSVSLIYVNTLSRFYCMRSYVVGFRSQKFTHRMILTVLLVVAAFLLKMFLSFFFFFDVVLIIVSSPACYCFGSWSLLCGNSEWCSCDLTLHASSGSPTPPLLIVISLIYSSSSSYCYLFIGFKVYQRVLRRRGKIHAKKKIYMQKGDIYAKR